MSEKKYDGTMVFLNSEDGVTYEKEWGGLHFTIEKLEDGSIKLTAPETDVQYLTEREGKWGPYFMASAYGGKAFINFRESDRDPGTDFAMLKFTEDCSLPPSPGKAKASPAKKGWAKTTAKAPAKKGGYKKSWK